MLIKLSNIPLVLCWLQVTVANAVLLLIAAMVHNA